MRRVAGICLAALSLCACGSEATGDDPVVRVYVSEALGGPGEGGNDLIRAEQLALEEAGGRAGRFRVELEVLDESSDQGPEAPSEVTENARRAVADPRAVALLGNSTSQNTAAALPITNQAGLLQVAPAATYVGLTSRGLDPDEPARYRPSGRPNFARVIADDAVQGAAMAEYLRRDGVRRVALGDDGSLYGRGLRAQLLERLEDTRGVVVVDTPDIIAERTSPSELARALKAERVEAFAFLGGVPGTVVRAFNQAAPGVRVYLGDQAFGIDIQADLGDAEEVVRITGPAADAPDAVAFSERFRKKFGTTPDPQVLGGYESVNAVLAAIERAGENGDDRDAVRDAFFATRREDSVFGPYRVTPEGEATIRRYGLYRVRNRKIVPAGTVTTR